MLLGVVALGAGCATIVVDPAPFECPPLTESLLDEYESLDTCSTEVPVIALQSWVREADRACRANQALLNKE